MTYTIHDLPTDERPRERLQKHGAEAMATSELIAIILGSGMKGMSVLQLAKEVIARFGTLQELAEATIEELCEIKGLGVAKAIQLKAAFCLGIRASKQCENPKYKIETPLHAYNLIKDQLENEKREHFVIILQDAKGYVINHQTIAIGTLTQALVHPREVFYPAIRHKAASIILAHNHPSGDPTPSDDDLALTKLLVSASRSINIPIHDHIVIGKGRYISLRQQGCAFN